MMIRTIRRFISKELKTLEDEVGIKAAYTAPMQTAFTKRVKHLACFNEYAG